MLQVDGYVLFNGKATVTPKTLDVPPFTLDGVWLYRPDTDCWYINGRIFGRTIVSDFEEDK